MKLSTFVILYAYSFSTDCGSSSYGMKILEYGLHNFDLLYFWFTALHSLGCLYLFAIKSWWQHQTETFSALLALYAGNSPVTGEFPTHRPGTRSLDVFGDLRLNKRLNKQSWGWWFKTPSLPLWRHCNVIWKTEFSLHLPGQMTYLWLLVT